MQENAKVEKFLFGMHIGPTITETKVGKVYLDKERTPPVFYKVVNKDHEFSNELDCRRLLSLCDAYLSERDSTDLKLYIAKCQHQNKQTQHTQSYCHFLFTRHSIACISGYR